jgi:hypothetical protein
MIVLTPNSTQHVSDPPKMSSLNEPGSLAVGLHGNLNVPMPFVVLQERIIIN